MNKPSLGKVFNVLKIALSGVKFYLDTAYNECQCIFLFF